LGINRPLFIAASTRDGEEVLVLDAFARLREKFPSAMLILAPRHPDRFDEVHELLRGRGLSSIRRSAGTRCDDATAVYLVDSMGELPRFYAAADVAFVGGSLLPFGGHNVLEPAAVGTPVVVGPHTGNFAEITQLLAANQALVVVDDSDGLRACVLDWLSDSNERDRVGRNGRAAVLRHRGATERTVEALRAVLSACANSPSSAAPRRSL
jgi:3-deoxy-D-manno-octulosonic-acid transferase